MKTVVVFLLSCAAMLAARSYDVVVVGGTPGGIAAAITAARLGQSVALLEYHRHLGGMSASGLGKSDITTREAIGGLFPEFVGRVYRYYVDKYGAGSENVKLCRDGYYFEPSVAEKIFNEMVTEQPRIQVFLNHRLDEVIRSGNRVTGIRAANRSTGVVEEFRARMFVDATYEGDLAAYAGARYRVGREARSDFDELHAGVVYQDPRTRTFLAGTTGKGDRRITAYTFRLCLSTDPANSYFLRQPPPNYDRTRYLGYIDDWKAGRMNSSKLDHFRVSGTVVRAFSIAPIPNHKTDVNMNPRLLGFPFCELNYAYPEAGWGEREKITEKIRNITLGLLYFLQNDSAVPPEQRKLARRFNLAKDEFPDNNHFPWQLYVREARRVVGMYTLTEHDVTVGPELGRPPIHADSITAGEYPIDSFPVRSREKGHDAALEGYLLMLSNITRPYQIPYGIIVPERVDGLLVPVAASTTHIAFSSIRLEPTWMALGQAAGVAAHLAITEGKQPRDLRVDQIQRILLQQGQVLTYFKDIDHKDPAYAALQYFGTKGFFRDYYARSHQPLDRQEAARWLGLVRRSLPEPVQVRWNEPGALTRAELSSILPAGIQWSYPNNRATAPGDPVLRGEFCRALYAWLR